MPACKFKKPVQAGGVGQCIAVDHFVDGLAEQQLLDRQFELLAGVSVRGTSATANTASGTWRGDAAARMALWMRPISGASSTTPGRSTTNIGM